MEVKKPVARGNCVFTQFPFLQVKSVKESGSYSSRTDLDLVKQKSLFCWLPNISAWRELSGLHANELTNLFNMQILKPHSQRFCSSKSGGRPKNLYVLRFLPGDSDAQPVWGTTALIIHPLVIFQVGDEDKKKKD